MNEQSIPSFVEQIETKLSLIRELENDVADLFDKMYAQFDLDRRDVDDFDTAHSMMRRARMNMRRIVQKMSLKS